MFYISLGMKCICKLDCKHIFIIFWYSKVWDYEHLWEKSEFGASWNFFFFFKKLENHYLFVYESEHSSALAVKCRMDFEFLTQHTVLHGLKCSSVITTAFWQLILLMKDCSEVVGVSIYKAYVNHTPCIPYINVSFNALTQQQLQKMVG